MINMNTFERQHDEIKEVVSALKEGLNSREILNLEEMAQTINILAGKLKIHINAEDRYLYPALLESNDEALKEKAKLYSIEMSGTFEIFNSFKDKFNTKTKISKDLKEFRISCEAIIKVLEDRISKEDKDLYINIKSIL